MRRSPVLLLLVTLSVLLVLSCNEDSNFLDSNFENKQGLDPSLESKNPLEFGDEYFVSEEEAILIASNHFQAITYEETKRTIEEKKVNRVSAIRDSVTNEALIYTLEYEGGGFCLIAADRRFEPILAYSETNTWGGNDLSGPDIFIAAYKGEISRIRKENNTAPREIEILWNRLKYYSSERGSSKNTNSPESGYSSCIYGQCLPIFCEYSSTTNVGPLTEPLSVWRQDGSFNFYSPSDNGCSGDCNRKLAGCGPVALAMLLRYHQSPLMNMTFNGATAYTDYSNMPKYAGACSNNSGGYKSSAMLIRLCGAAMNSNYGIFGTCNTATLPDKIGDGLDWFGYSHDGKGNLNDRYSAIKNDLKFGYPVILTGSQYSWTPWENWHIWVADGIKEHSYQHWADNGSCVDIWNGASPASCGVCPDCVDCFSNTTTEWHMNWGWGSTASNGWYNASPYTIGVYQHYMRAYTKIRP